MQAITAELVLQLATMLVAGGAVYGGIKTGMSHMMKDIKENHDSITRCHARIDHHLETQHNRRKGDRDE